MATSVVVTDNVPSGIAISYATSAARHVLGDRQPGAVQLRVLAPGETVTMTFNAVGTSVGA